MVRAKKQYGAVQLASLAAQVIDPLTAKRGFAKADLVLAWSDVVGPRYAALTRPEKLRWPRNGFGAVLTVRVDGPAAVFLQHESEQFIARVNAFLGYSAVTSLRIVQKPIAAEGPPPAAPEPSEAELAAVQQSVATIEAGGLRDALERLGTAVAADRLARP